MAHACNACLAYLSSHSQQHDGGISRPLLLRNTLLAGETEMAETRRHSQSANTMPSTALVGTSTSGTRGGAVEPSAIVSVVISADSGTNWRAGRAAPRLLYQRPPRC